MIFSMAFRVRAWVAPSMANKSDYSMARKYGKPCFNTQTYRQNSKASMIVPLRRGLQKVSLLLERADSPAACAPPVN